MIDISVSGLVKEFEVGNKILDGLSFQVDTGERVGLLGKNGAGKTTLFKILTGELDWDEGEIALAPGKRIGLISQIPVYPPEYTVEMVLNTAFDRLTAMEEEMGELTRRMEAGENDPALLRRYDTLSASFEAGGGYDTVTALNKVCNGLGISRDMREQFFDDLSGGERTRVNLARLILEDTDILLLDEPTNHLDLHATEWLEEYLDKFRGTVLAISHDRWFLDRVVSRIVELEHGKAEFYSGNYSFYVVEKQRRYEEKLRQYEKEQAEIQRLRETARKMHEHNTELLHKRAFSIEKRIERIQTTARPDKARSMKAAFGEKEFHGDEVFTIKGLAKGFDGRTLFSGVDLEVVGGERIALLGDNGTGKSTFLKILLGEEQPTPARFGLARLSKWAICPKSCNLTTRSAIWWIPCSMRLTALLRLPVTGWAHSSSGERTYLSRVRPVGGERSRLRLCILMDQKINLLVLDEPTNHLDIASREWIEAAVEGYEGVLLFVSHDRYFIDRFADRVWMLEDGQITDFNGTYAQYKEKLARKAAAPATKEPEAKTEKKEKPKRTGGTKMLEKEVAAAEREVEKAEIRMDELTQAIEENAVDYLKLQELYEQRNALEDEIAHLYAVWENLAAELEEARG